MVCPRGNWYYPALSKGANLKWIYSFLFFFVISTAEAGSRCLQIFTLETPPTSPVVHPPTLQIQVAPLGRNSVVYDTNIARYFIYHRLFSELSRQDRSIESQILGTKSMGEMQNLIFRGETLSAQASQQIRYLYQTARLHALPRLFMKTAMDSYYWSNQFSTDAPVRFFLPAQVMKESLGELFLQKNDFWQPKNRASSILLKLLKSESQSSKIFDDVYTISHPYHARSYKYQSLMTALKEAGVGGPSGLADRRIIAELMLGERDSSAPRSKPTFFTADKGILRGLLVLKAQEKYPMETLSEIHKRVNHLLQQLKTDLRSNVRKDKLISEIEDFALDNYSLKSNHIPDAVYGVRIVVIKDVSAAYLDTTDYIPKQSPPEATKTPAIDVYFFQLITGSGL